ncbi:MAG TPA: signal peptidase I [Candidatus Angelobacter sp.]|nr:signal peptidase I [Candidatus Angelobacter sp.]
MSTNTPDAGPETRDRHSAWLLVGGLVGRTWLWFVAACVAITLLPVLVGWRPYVVESGSMQPRIDVGDVVLAAPFDRSDDLLGRVVVFADPARPGTTKTHRVVGRNADGTLTTQGDANPTADSAPVPPGDVRGLARLRVRFTGLPLVWARSGQWLLVIGLLLSLALAAVVASRDREDDEDEDEDEDGSSLDDLRSRVRAAGGPAAVATATDAGLHRARRDTVRPLARPGTLVVAPVIATLVLTAVLVPASGATLTASTRTSSSSWTLAGPGYPSVVLGLGPWLYWRLDDTTGVTAADSSGNGRTGTYLPDAGPASFTRGVAGALTSGSPDLAVTLNGTTACLATTSTTAVSAPTQLTEVVWFRTTSTAGGKLLGFEAPRAGVAAMSAGGAYDRQLYLDAAGRVWFGIGTTTRVGISSPAGLNDGAWHMAAATLGPAGMALYVDGAQVATDPATAAASYSGWWRAGCGNLSGWVAFWDGGGSPTGSTNQARNFPFAGSLDEVAVYPTPLTASQVAALYAAR